MARPAKDDAEKLTKTVAFRLTEADHSTYIKKQDASGLSKSEFFREYILTNKTEVIARPKASKEKKRLLFLVNKASNNLNQLAHRANAEHIAGTIDQQTYSDILFQLQDLSLLMRASINNAN